MTEYATTAAPTTDSPGKRPAALRRTLVRDVMTTAVVSVRPDTTFEDVVNTLRSNHVRAVPVLDPEGRLHGVISEGDLMKTTALGDPRRPSPQGRWHRGGGAWARPMTAEKLMTSPVVSVVPTDSVARAARTMYAQELSWLAVVEAAEHGPGRLVGVLGRSDLLTVFSRDDAELRREIADTLFTQLLLLNPERVHVEVDQGVVTLSGHLPNLVEARMVTEFVEKLEGVVAVIHGLTCDVPH
jgi:CBS domain-containing protein